MGRRPKYYYDEVSAARAVLFFENYLHHTKGKWMGKSFKLLPWQKSALEQVFGWKRASDHTRRYRNLYVEIPKKNGKALALDTKIPTPTGWKLMGDLIPGDQVFDERGEICNVIGITVTQNNRPCYKITFNDETSIVADAAHEWYVSQLSLRDGGAGSKPVYVIRETAEIKSKLKCGSANNFAVDVADPLILEEKDLPIPPYVLGCWLGDGTSANAMITISTKDQVIVDHINQCGVSTKLCKSSNENSDVYLLGSPGRTGSGKPLQSILRELGLLKNKHIPSSYLRAGYHQRMELLQGLMDTDGYCSSDGQCEFTTILPELRDGILELIRTLGLKPTVKTAEATIDGREYGDYFRIQFFAFKDNPPFRLKRHIERLKPNPGKRTRSGRRHIIAVEEVDSVPVKCIMVDSKSHLYLAGDGMIPTHNSEFAAGIALYLTYADGEKAAEVCSVAGDTEQAAIVFNMAKTMVDMNKSLSKISQQFRRSLFVPDTMSRYEVKSSESGTKHGPSWSGIIFDEFHVQKNRELYDTLIGGTAAREQPLTVMITTAGFDKTSICYEVHQYALDILSGSKKDDEFLGIIYAADEEDDWTKKSTWRKANPALGLIVQESFFRNECKKALAVPGRQNAFKRLHLNIWTEQASLWLDVKHWDKLSNEFEPEDFRTRDCFIGLDLSSTRDITALGLVFPPESADEKWRLITRFYIPGDNVKQRQDESGVPYLEWVQEGWLIATPGNVVDYEYIRKDIRNLGGIIHIREVALDRWNATYMMTNLIDDGLKAVPFGQGFASMSGPSREFEKLIMGGDLEHDGNPVMRWMVKNVAVKEDPAGNLKPDKSASNEKIDGVVAAIMGLGRAIFNDEDTGRSVYESRGILTI